MAGDYSIWTFCYARGQLPVDFMGGSPICSNQGLAEIAMAYSLIASAPTAARQRLIVVDTGFSDGLSMTGRNFAGVEAPATLLAKVGRRPEEVDTVILTHLHFDHAGNIDAFPNARVLVQRREYDEWKSALAEAPDPALGKQSWVMSSLDPAVFTRLEAAIAAGRVDFLDGDQDVAPGVRCHLAADTHSFGSQWVAVDTADGPRVLAGDCVYWYANLERMWPPAYVQGNPWAILRTYERLRRLVEDRLDRIVPGHDMQIFARHPSWTAGHNPVAEIHLAAGEPVRATAAAVAN